jgi:hypothetical protein
MKPKDVKLLIEICGGINSVANFLDEQPQTLRHRLNGFLKFTPAFQMRLSMALLHLGIKARLSRLQRSIWEMEKAAGVVGNVPAVVSIDRNIESEVDHEEV